MPKLATLAATSEHTTGNNIKGIANSLSLTRQGTTISTEAVDGIEGKKVPLLKYHNWESTPIGSATMVSVDKEGLHYEGEIFDSIEDKQQILDSIKAGVMSVSVGFGYDNMDKDGVIHSLDLYELSITPVPADSGATITQGLKLTDKEIYTMAVDQNEDPNKKQDDPNAQPDPNKKPDASSDDFKQTVLDFIDDETASMKSLTETVSVIAKAVNADGSDDSKSDPNADPEADKAKADKQAMLKDLKKLRFSLANNYEARSAVADIVRHYSK